MKTTLTLLTSPAGRALRIQLRGSCGDSGQPPLRVYEKPARCGCAETRAELGDRIRRSRHARRQTNRLSDPGSLVAGPAELVFEAAGRKIEIPAGGSVTVPMNWKCTGKLGYGTYPVAVSVGSSSVELPVCVTDAIDLRGTWVLKALPAGEDGAGFGVYDRDGNWDYARMPGRWQNIKGFETYTGAVWFRKYVLAPSAWAGHDAQLNLGEISGKAKVFANETEVEKLPSRKGTSLYNVSASVFRAGDNNLIAVRIENSGPKSGLTSWPMELKVLPSRK